MFSVIRVIIWYDITCVYSIYSDINCVFYNIDMYEGGAISDIANKMILTKLLIELVLS